MDVQLWSDGYPGDSPFDTALSRAALTRVAAGELGGVVRLHQPGSNVAFGRQDVVSPGYRAAVSAARAAGFEAVERLAGGRAAVFHDETIAFSMASPAVDPRRGITERFQTVAQRLATVLVSLGFDARVGEVPGEYCPGSYSVNLGGAQKVIGIGQRLIRGAAHVGGVLVVGGRERINEVLLPVYEALSIDWDPEKTGDLRGTDPSITLEDVIEALRQEWSSETVPSRPDATTVSLARSLAREHASPGGDD